MDVLVKKWWFGMLEVEVDGRVEGEVAVEQSEMKTMRNFVLFQALRHEKDEYKGTCVSERVVKGDVIEDKDIGLKESVMLKGQVRVKVK